MIDFTHNPIIPADYKSRGRGLPYEASPLALSLLCDSQNFYPVIYPVMNEKFERFETEGGRRAVPARERKKLKTP